MKSIQPKLVVLPGSNTSRVVAVRENQAGRAAPVRMKGDRAPAPVRVAVQHGVARVDLVVVPVADQVVEAIECLFGQADEGEQPRAGGGRSRGARQRARADHRVSVGQHPSLADVERAGVGTGQAQRPVEEPLRRERERAAHREARRQVVAERAGGGAEAGERRPFPGTSGCCRR